MSTNPAVRRRAGARRGHDQLAVALAIGLTGALASAPACAQQIGAAAIARNQVSGSQPARSIAVGSDVFRNEIVRTGGDSQAKLVFLDDTNLALGPQSSVTLDRFVYSGDNSAQAVSVNFARGVFRFTSGNSDKRAYQLRTPLATIGVRGTVLDIRSEPSRTTVVLVEGEATVCVRRQAAEAYRGSTRRDDRQCRTISTPGDAAVVTASGVARASGGAGWSFALTCRNSVSELCGASRFAALRAPDFADALCGR